MGLSNKSLAVAAVVIIIVLAVMYGTTANAQFRPCVWPNTCLQ